MTWKAVTTGNYGAIDLWLEQRGGAARLQDRAGVRRGRRSPTSASSPRVFAAGGLERAVKPAAPARGHARAPPDPAPPHQAARHRRHPPLRPRPAGRRPPHVVEPDLSRSARPYRRPRPFRRSLPSNRLLIFEFAGRGQPQRWKSRASRAALPHPSELFLFIAVDHKPAEASWHIYPFGRRTMKTSGRAIAEATVYIQKAFR